MTIPKLLDIFCGAGGCSEGYRRAGFAPYGIDNDPKPLRHYPFPYICMDALEGMDKLLRGEGLTFSNGETLYLKDFAAFHASPPCLAWTVAGEVHRQKGKEYPELIKPSREILSVTRKPYVIENVMGAKSVLINPFKLCGTMFGIKIKRHRLFECSFDIYFPPYACSCYQPGFVEKPNGKHRIYSFDNGARLLSISGHNFKVSDASKAMDIDWMTGKELSQAIPPAYTEYIGKYLLKEVMEGK